MKNSRRKTKAIAHVIAVNMGYGHHRPAHALRFLSGGKVWIANDYSEIPKADKKLWESSRKWYERISRFKRVPILGSIAFGAMNELQRIPDFYPKRDLSSPSFQVRQFYFLIRRRNWMKHLIEKLAQDPKPLICTFMAPAFAAEEFGYPGEIFCLPTDSDISRAWVSMRPKKSRIQYLAPTHRVAERLKLYGVPEKNIWFTGFPLPDEAIGGSASKFIRKDLARRICSLDPNKNFIRSIGPSLKQEFGTEFYDNVHSCSSRSIRLAFAVGGAGAQRELGVQALNSLQGLIREKKVRMDFIAGTRPEVAEYFEDAIKECNCQEYFEKGRIRILIEEDRNEYFKKFSLLMRKIDILWTKPSELSFYAGLGLPIIMAPTIGSQEDFNRRWLKEVGGGVDQLDPRYVNQWLMDWIESGALARMAWHGYIEAPTHGAYWIANTIQGEAIAMHDVPLVV